MARAVDTIGSSPRRLQRAGCVVVELAPRFAPQHAANIRQLARQGYYDGLAVVRSQDNFVVQWGDPDGKRDLGKARATLPAEFTKVPAGYIDLCNVPIVVRAP